MQFRVAVAREALATRITRIVYHFVASADDIVRAVAFGTALALLAVGVAGARVVAVQEVGADVPRTTPRVTLKVIVAGVLCHLLAVEALRGVHARVVTAAVRCVDAVVVQVAKHFLRQGDSVQHICS